MTKSEPIDSFSFAPGRKLAGKYEVVSQIGEGWESEVYIVRELATGIERAAKFFFPERNPNNRTLRGYAKKLHRLKDCQVLVGYQTQEKITFKRAEIPFLVSEYVEGELLNHFLNRQRGKRISVFQGVHLLHALACGLEPVHRMGEYHGDLHTENVIVRRHGLGFDLKLIDLYIWPHPKREIIQDDVVDMIKIFHLAIGGAKHYKSQPVEVKAICCGLKRSLIARKFKNAGQLRQYLENMAWS